MPGIEPGQQLLCQKQLIDLREELGDQENRSYFLVAISQGLIFGVPFRL